MEIFDGVSPKNCLNMYSAIPGFFPGKYCRSISLLKIESSFPSRPRSGQGQELGGLGGGGGGGGHGGSAPELF